MQTPTPQSTPTSHAQGHLFELLVARLLHAKSAPTAVKPEDPQSSATNPIYELFSFLTQSVYPDRIANPHDTYQLLKSHQIGSSLIKMDVLSQWIHTSCNHLNSEPSLPVSVRLSCKYYTDNQELQGTYESAFGGHLHSCTSSKVSEQIPMSDTFKVLFSRWIQPGEMSLTAAEQRQLGFEWNAVAKPWIIRAALQSVREEHPVTHLVIGSGAVDSPPQLSSPAPHLLSGFFLIQKKYSDGSHIQIQFFPSSIINALRHKAFTLIQNA